MAKDPRFNFYPDNYEGGTDFFTLEQDGAFLRLLILQFRNGSFTDKQAVLKLMQRCPESPKNAQKIWESIRHKFETDGTNFWSKRMRLEIDKALQYAEDQSERAKLRWDKTKGAYASADANAYAEPVPDLYRNDATNTSTSTISNSSTKTTTKKNTANADAYSSERKELIFELNSLTGREFDPDAAYFRKDINARIKQYGVPDLIDMIRFMVYKRKDTEWGEFLQPSTLFGAKKCGTYMDAMLHHRKNNIIPKRDTGKSNGLKTKEELYADACAAIERKAREQSNL